MNEVKKLNKEQTKAVKHKKGPLLIIAGAGTGKTTVITERIKYLIEKGLANPNEILALTFTEKASREMEERVDIALPYGYSNMWISTFHSFCDRVLRAEALQIGLDPKYKLMTEAVTTQFIRENIFKFELNYFRPLGNPTKFIGGLLQHFARLQDENIAPADYLRWVNSKFKIKNSKLNDDEKIENQKYMELANAYKKYEELKVRDGVFDYGDLIVKSINLFKVRPNILAEYKKQFKYILIDEFQDTNYAQYELIKMLAGKDGNVTVVADDDQSIYRFRGAAVSNVVQFRKSYPKTEIVVLTENYRSTQEILDRSHDLIEHNNPDRLEVVENINKKLKAVGKPDGEPITFIHTARVENEAEEVVRRVRQLSEEKKYKWGDFAILVRANNHSEPFVRAFQRAGIPYQFLGPGRLFRQPEIMDLIAYLKVLYDFEDSASLYRIFSLEALEIDQKDLIRLVNFARKKNSSLFEVSENLGAISLKEDSKEKIEKIIKLINNHIKIINKETAGQLLYYFLQELDLLPALLHPDTAEGEKRANNISKFFDKLKTYDIDHTDSGVRAVVDWIDLASEMGESPAATDTDWYNINAVNILTTHSAKGLEFPVVFLVNLVAQRFPTIERREMIPIPDDLIKEVLPQGDAHLQEERRLFYVGMTRACDRLFLTAANFYGEGKREKKLSPFIFEAMGDKALTSEETTQVEQLTLVDFIKTPSRKDDKMRELHVDTLSYSQIEAFRLCPLHFRLRYILGIPSEPSAPLSFGDTVHVALNEFYQEVNVGEKATVKLLMDKYKNAWKNSGYISREHENKMFERGKKYLSDYFKKEFNPKNLPILLEYPFVVDLPKDNGEQVKIKGKIDRIDALPGGGIEVVDYKTSERPKSLREVNRDLQLTFYALAATLIKGEPFGKKVEDITLSLYYFENQEKISTKRTQAQLTQAIKEIYNMKRSIEGSDFKCSKNMLCETCEYKMFCRSDG